MANPKTSKHKLTAVSNGPICKIDYYNLGDKVLELRSKGFSITEITDYINTNLLKEPNQFVSRMSIHRYIQKHMKNPEEYDQRKTDPAAINELNELNDLLTYVDGQLEIAEGTLRDMKAASKARKGIDDEKIKELRAALKSCDMDTKYKKEFRDILDLFDDIDPYQNVKDITSVMNATEKALARKQSILANIIDWKSKVYTFMSLQKILTTTMNIVREKDITAYAEVKETFNNNPVIQQCFRYIPKVNAKLRDENTPS